MGEPFYIRVPDATEIDTGYGAFKNEMDDVIENAAASIESLVGLEAFTGMGADSVKAYFTQVHGPLLYLLSLLVNELDTVYNSPYYSGVLAAARNDEAGEFPSWDLWDKARAFQRFADDDTPPIDSLLRAAVQAAPQGYGFSTPNTSSFKNGMGSKGRKLDATRESFESAESSGVSALASADQNFQQLYNALNSAIARCANGNVKMAGYKSGDFRAATADLNLREIAESTRTAQVAESGAVLAAKQQGAQNREIDIERERRKAEEEKRKFAIWGEVAQVVILGAAVAGLVLATGGVAIAFSAVGVAGAVHGTVQRANHLSAMRTDARADLDKEDKAAGAFKGIGNLKDYGKGADTIARNVRQVKDDKANGLQFAPAGGVRNIGRTAAGMVVSVGTQLVGDYLDENIGDKLEGDASLVYKESKKVVEKGIDLGSEKALETALPKMKLTDSFRGHSALEQLNATAKTQKTVGLVAGVFGFAAGCGQIYCDHQVEQYDQLLDKCEEDRQNNDAYKQSLSNGPSYQWAVQW